MARSVETLVPRAPEWTIVIPVKGTAEAKTRLNASAELAMAIALDTAEAALAVARVVVVTSAGAAPVFARLGAAVLPDPGQGLNAAVDAGIAAAGAGPIAVLLGDLPGMTSGELAAALRAATNFPLAMVADAAGEGTVLLTALRGVDHRPAFGHGSCEAHHGAGYVRLAIPRSWGLRNDVDVPAHLDQLQRAHRLGWRTDAVLERNSA